MVVLVLVHGKNHGVRFGPGTQGSVAPYIHCVHNAELNDILVVVPSPLLQEHVVDGNDSCY